MSGIQVKVALDKEAHPERYCPVSRCLWRTDDAEKYPSGYCPRHVALAPEPDEDVPTLGPCGCVDYHMADCPLMTSRYGGDEPDYSDDDYYDDHPPDGFGY